MALPCDVSNVKPRVGVCAGLKLSKQSVYAVPDLRLAKMDHEWDFGDGASDGVYFGTSDVHNDHTYDEAGRYTATLTVTDNDADLTGAGNSDTCQVPIDVREAATGEVTIKFVDENGDEIQNTSGGDWTAHYPDTSEYPYTRSDTTDDGQTITGLQLSDTPQIFEIDLNSITPPEGYHLRSFNYIDKDVDNDVTGDENRASLGRNYDD